MNKGVYSQKGGNIDVHCSEVCSALCKESIQEDTVLFMKLAQHKVKGSL